MERNKKTKIILVTHKPFKIPEGKCFVPVHAGRSVMKSVSKDGYINKKDMDWLLDNTIGDDTGDNISDKNRKYCECCALYWAWKNYDKLDNPDYIGFMHYRRHFVFDNNYWEKSKKSKTEKAWGFLFEPCFDENYQKRLNLFDEEIEKACLNYDVITTNFADFTLAWNPPLDLREDYLISIPGTKLRDIDLMIEILNRKYPQYKEDFKEIYNGSKKLMFQMFIMKKELFFEYCEFLFDILFEIEKRVDYSCYSVNGTRTIAYLGEVLLTFFLVIIKKKYQNLKVLNRASTILLIPQNQKEAKKYISQNSTLFVKYYFIKALGLIFKNPVLTKQKELLKKKYREYKSLMKRTKAAQKRILRYENEMKKINLNDIKIRRGGA